MIEVKSQKKYMATASSIYNEKCKLIVEANNKTLDDFISSEQKRLVTGLNKLTDELQTQTEISEQES